MMAKYGFIGKTFRVKGDKIIANGKPFDGYAYAQDGKSTGSKI
jgi:hypothetical protein